MFAWEEWFGDLFIISQRRIVRADRTEIELTERETVILGVLVLARGNVRSRSQLLLEVRGGHAGYRKEWEKALDGGLVSLRHKVTGCTFQIVAAEPSEKLGWRLIGFIRHLA